MTAATDVYAMVMREYVTPGLRSLGFTGSHQGFKLHDQAAWRLLGIQRSTANTGQRVKFTINLAIISKTDWEQARQDNKRYPAQPNPNLVYGNWYWHQRIGALMPGGHDHWWALTPHTTPEQLANSVLNAVREYALPELRSPEALSI